MLRPENVGHSKTPWSLLLTSYQWALTFCILDVQVDLADHLEIVFDTSTLSLSKMLIIKVYFFGIISKKNSKFRSFFLQIWNKSKESSDLFPDTYYLFLPTLEIIPIRSRKVRVDPVFYWLNKIVDLSSSGYLFGILQYYTMQAYCNIKVKPCSTVSNGVPDNWTVPQL